MKFIKRALKFVGVINLVKIPGKNFFNLSNSEMAMMIDSFIAGGNEKFDESALPEFMLVPNRNPRLEEIRITIQQIDERNRTIYEPDGLGSSTGTQELKNLATSLRKLR